MEQGIRGVREGEVEQGIRGVREGEDGARNKRCEGGRERVEQGIRGGREGGRGWSKE